MGKYIVRRLLQMIVVLFVISLLTFATMRAVPGGPFSTEKNLPQRALEQLEAKYNLDEPMHMQYLHYMGDIAIPRLTENELPRTVMNDYMINIYIPGVDKTLRWVNFGPSYKSVSQTVNSIIKDTLPVSAVLGVGAMIVAIVIGIPAGIISALNRNTRWDYVAMGVAIVGVSVPVIVSGPILRYVFGVQLRWLPPTGWGSFEHLIMPAFALGFSQSARLARLTRASLLQVLNEDYIRTARSKGLNERVVIGLHALKNAMIPVITTLGPMLAFLVTGSFVAELIFGIPGMGKFFVVSITNRDYPVIMGTTLLLATIVILANLAVDLIYVWLDPRIQYS
ncbi:MAG: ABC transporter permease [Anaerolineae bacterium]|nr:ABC transporter permease [Anaerolineae bacterium]